MKTSRASRALTIAMIALGAIGSDRANASEAMSGIMQDFDSLGGNDVLLERARALNPDASIRIVQDRIVSRRNRFEFAPEFASVLGGDAYTSTQNFGVNVHWHLTPRWSLGLKYAYSANRLRAEGENLIRDTSVDGKAFIPQIDFPKSQAMATLSWYPIYGKMNLYDLGVAHFDVYAIAGGGQMELKSGTTTTYTAGGGVGFWVSQHLTTRLELRYQHYKANHRTGPTDMNLTVAGLQVGYLL